MTKYIYFNIDDVIWRIDRQNFVDIYYKDREKDFEDDPEELVVRKDFMFVDDDELFDELYNNSDPDMFPQHLWEWVRDERKEPRLPWQVQSWESFKDIRAVAESLDKQIIVQDK